MKTGESGIRVHQEHRQGIGLRNCRPTNVLGASRNSYPQSNLQEEGKRCKCSMAAQQIQGSKATVCRRNKCLSDSSA
jgi:hypothetical protein